MLIANIKFRLYWIVELMAQMVLKAQHHPRVDPPLDCFHNCSFPSQLLWSASPPLSLIPFLSLLPIIFHFNTYCTYLWAKNRSAVIRALTWLSILWDRVWLAKKTPSFSVWLRGQSTQKILRCTMNPSPEFRVLWWSTLSKRQKLFTPRFYCFWFCSRFLRLIYLEFLITSI